jgi:ferric-dicitrate binding protein FerR (iron transport regulator)
VIKRRTAIALALVLAVLLLVWRGPHIADDVRYAILAPPAATDLALADDSSVELDGRRITVYAGMGVDCAGGKGRAAPA